MPPRQFAFVIAVFICLCGMNATASEEKVTWKFATLAPKGIGWSKNIQEFMMPAIEKATDGQLQIKWYWGGIMGDDEDYIKKMRIGQLDGMAGSAQGVVLAIPEMTVLSLPFLFESWEEVDHIRKIMYPVFDGYAEKHGVKLVYWADQDFDPIYSTSWEFDNLEDFKEAKFIAWFGPLEEAVFEALGANSIPINVPEAASAIRQGIVNADNGPSVWMVGAQVYTVFKYITTYRIRYSPAGLIVTTEAWEKLTQAHQRALLDARLNVLEEFCMLTRIDNEKAVQAMVEYGLKKVDVEPAKLAPIKAKCRPVWDEQADRLYPRELLDEVLFQLENYRRMKK